MPNEPLAPRCSECREPAGTCFPEACKAHLARQAARKPRGYIPEVDLTSEAWRRTVEADNARRAAREAGK